MTKLKEKMIQWSRYVETIKKLLVVFMLIVIFVFIFVFMKYDAHRLWVYILGIICGVLVTFENMIECVSQHNKEFVQKNSFWNIVLADGQVMSVLTTLLFMISITLYDFVSKFFMILEIIILFIRLFAFQRITDFFKKRLIE